uniref:BTB domain-containing protein n=1 Tax=Globodera rostochiensis TaxID=31243 RepID=A0A914ID14_GLORO
MPTFLFLAAICLIVVASILLETDASPKNKKPKLEKGPSSSGIAQSTPVNSAKYAKSKLFGGTDAEFAGLGRSCGRSLFGGGRRRKKAFAGT